MRLFNLLASKTSLRGKPLFNSIAFGTLAMSGLMHLAAPSAANAQVQNTRCPAEYYARSIEGSLATQIEFRNVSGYDMRIYWLDYQGNRVLFNTLRPNQTYVQNTFLTHPWVATDFYGNCLGVVYYPDSIKRIVYLVTN